MNAVAQLFAWILVPLAFFWYANRIRRRGRTVREGLLIGFSIGAAIVIAESLDGQSPIGSVAAAATALGLGAGLLLAILLLVSKHAGRSKIEITW